MTRSTLRWPCGHFSNCCPLFSSSSSSSLVNPYSLVILVIVLLSLVACDWNDGAPSAPSQFGSLPSSSGHNYNLSANNKTQWKQSRDSTFWLSKRHRHKHRLQLAQSSERSINDILRTLQQQQQPQSLARRAAKKPFKRRGGPSLELRPDSAESFRNAQRSPFGSEYDPEFAASSSHHQYHQNNHITLPYSGLSYLNQSILQSKSFPSPHHTRSSAHRGQSHHHSSKKRHHHGSGHGRSGHHQEQPKKRPNIIFMLTDDQDIELGSMNYMPKAMSILSRGGVHVKNAYVTTP